MWCAIIVTLALSGIAGTIWAFRVRERERRSITKRLVEARINTCLMVYVANVGLDAPETTRILALLAAVRHGQLFPPVYYSTNEEVDRWVHQNLELMGLAHPQTVKELAAPEREALKTAMMTRDEST